MSQEIIDRAQALLREGRVKEAISLLRPLVESGDTVAKSNLGFILSQFVTGDGLDEGVALLTEACEEGEPSACHNLAGLWCGLSPSIGKDLKKAARYYLRARELGGPVADEGFYERWEKELNC